MRIHLIALTVAVGMVGLGAASAARAGGPGASITGGVSASGAMAAHAGGGNGGMRGGGGGFAGGRAGRAGFAGSHFGGGYAGGHFDGVHIVGGRYGGAVAAGGPGRAAAIPRGSYLVHSDFVARGGNRAAAHAPVALAARGGMAAGVGEAARTDTMALGPRMGSAAAAARVNPMSRVDRMGSLARVSRTQRVGADRMIRPHPGVRPRRPPARNPQTMQAKMYPRPQRGYAQYLRQPPIFCDLPAAAIGIPQPFGCPQPVKTKMEMH